MKNFLFYCLLVILLAGFTSKKIDLKPNKLNSEKEYIKELPFSFDYGVPIIKATINNKEYKFLFDTGMPTALSKNIVSDNNLKSVKSTIGRDINGNSRKENYIIIDQITIAGVDFKNIETLSVDLKSGFEIGCLNIDGVIGNNLILNAVWEIDYKNKMIRLTNNKNLLYISNDATVLSFKTNKKRNQYSPKIDISINNKKIKGVKFDTGSNGGFRMPLDHFSKVIDPNKSIESFGVTSASLYGKGKNRTYIDAKVKSIKLNKLSLNNQIVSFNNKVPLIGSRYLKHYKVIIDYNVSKIYMMKQLNYDNSTLENFGFLNSVINNKAIITKIYKNSKAEKKGLQLGDEIIKINDLKVADLITQDACSFMFNSPLKAMKTINIILLRDKETIALNLEKETLLN